MLKIFIVIVVIAIYKVDCEEKYLPQVLIPDRGVKLLLPQNPPKPPLLRLVGQKFSLPQCCQNVSEWEDVDLSLQILSEYNEDPERSAFTSLINLVKFILIKEELSCIDAIKGPIVQVQRPEGQIFKLDNSEISSKIEAALANKPKQRATPVEYYDNIDISNMVPIWRPRGNCRRRILVNTPVIKELKTNCTCSGPQVLQNLGPLAVIGSSLKPVMKGASRPCMCPKSPILALNSANNKLRSLPSTNIKPVVIGCGGNYNLCQKLVSPVIAGCPKLASAPIISDCPQLASVPIMSGFPKLASAPALSGYPKLATVPFLSGCPKLARVPCLSGCPKANMILGGCPCSAIGCPTCSNILTGGYQPKQSLTVTQAESIGNLPMMNPYGKIMKQVTRTVLVPYTVSQLVA